MEPKIIKRIYFIRHGKTDGNAKNIYQNGDIPLSETGKKQATFVAERFQNISVDTIISSDFTRAADTAKMIAKQITVPVGYSELFREVKRPSDIVGKEKSDPEAKKIVDEMLARELEPTWHHSDEENLFDLERRARKALAYLSDIPETNIAVVSHEIFIKMMMSVMAQEDTARVAELFRGIRFFMIGENTGITIIELSDFGYEKKWRLCVWNDRAHLG